MTNTFLQPIAREIPRGVAWLRSLPWPAAAALLALGLLGLLLGARHRRGVAAVGGFAAGALAGMTLLVPALRSASMSLGATTAIALSSVVVAGVSFVLPWMFPFTLGAAVGAPLGARLPVGVPALGPALGAVAAGGVAVIGARIVAASTAGLLGALMLMAGVVAVGDGIPGARLLVAHPIVAIGVSLILGIASAAWQIEGAWAVGGGGGARKSKKPELSPKPASRDA